MRTRMHGNETTGFTKRRLRWMMPWLYDESRSEWHVGSDNAAAYD
jgi:hypothetical protein